VFADSGHVPQLDEPERVIDVLVDGGRDAITPP
jgi:hypothetical protein